MAGREHVSVLDPFPSAKEGERIDDRADTSVSCEHNLAPVLGECDVASSWAGVTVLEC